MKRANRGCWLLILALFALVAACTSRPASHDEPVPNGPAASQLRSTDIGFAGCAVTYAGPRCELSEARTLTFWVAGAERAQAATERGPLAFDHVDVLQAGARYALHVPKAASFVELRVPGTSRGMRLAVLDNVSVPLLSDASELRTQGKYAQARAQVLQGMSALPAPLQTRARALLARLALSEGDFEAAATGLRASMTASFADGRISDAVYDARALAYVLVTNLQSYPEAREVLARAEQAADHDPTSLAQLPHYAGLLALETGDVRNALTQFRLAAMRSERLGLIDAELLARQKEASTLALLGRHAEAVRLQQQLLAAAPPKDACQAADAHERLTWIAILAEPAAGSELERMASRASEDAGKDLAHCAGPWRARNHAINVGLLALLRNDVAAASAALEQLTNMQGGQDALMVTWQYELQGRVELANGRARVALDAFAHALALSQRAGLWDSEQLAWLGIGRSNEALSKNKAAIDAYSAADRMMDRLLGGIPLGEGQAAFLHDREAGTERLVTLLVRLGRAAEALQIARHARARIMQALSHPERLASMSPALRVRWEAAIRRYHALRAELERAQADAWKLPADQLRMSRAAQDEQHRAALAALDEAQALLPQDASALAPPRANEALLAYLPTSDGVIAFIARGAHVRALTLPAVDAKSSTTQLGEALLAPFRADLSAVQRVRVIAYGALAQLDVHALELDGQPLLMQRAVAYGLDSALQSSADTAHAGALIVADPTGDLPAAAREGQTAARMLSAPASSLLVRDAATRAALLGSLSKVALFHYAGHGQFAGNEGIDSGLRLADGALSLGDILTLPAAPPLVVLSACEGARSDAAGLAAGLSIAQAFVAAGARAVVAATRPVADDDTRVLLEAFYEARSADPSADEAEMLRVAQLKLRTQRPDADWSSFRLLVP